jgi:hypothetical protein
LWGRGPSQHLIASVFASARKLSSVSGAGWTLTGSLGWLELVLQSEEFACRAAFKFSSLVI